MKIDYLFVFVLALLLTVMVIVKIEEPASSVQSIDAPIQSDPEPVVLNAVAKTIVALTDGEAVLNILEFRGDTVIVEINGRDTVAYKIR